MPWIVTADHDVREMLFRRSAKSRYTLRGRKALCSPDVAAAASRA
ncbi:hypothetical protein [Amycolatopsis magusensis]